MGEHLEAPLTPACVVYFVYFVYFVLMGSSSRDGRKRRREDGRGIKTVVLLGRVDEGVIDSVCACVCACMCCDDGHTSS